MKKSLLYISALLLLAGCYPDYVRDYDEGAGVFTAYQYDLRTFVIGESESFDFTAALGGVINNTTDRAVKVVVDNSLLSKDLTELTPGKEYASFTALEGLLGSGSFGSVSQKYVTDEVRASGITALTELPETYYTIKGLDGMTIKNGRFTATASIKATDFVKEDANMFKPCYALGFQIISATDAEIVPERSYEIIAVKCENKLFGSWGRSCDISVQDKAGNEMYTMNDEFSVVDDKVYTLVTKDAKTLTVDKIAGAKGKMSLTLNDDNTISVACMDGSVVISEVPGMPSTFNGATKLEDREIELNYKYESSGYVYVVNEKLKFRDRTRDGVLEYQGETK